MFAACSYSVGRLSKRKLKTTSVFWITPIRALEKKSIISAKEAVEASSSEGRVLSGDSSFTIKQGNLRSHPEFLITTPEVCIYTPRSKKFNTSYFKELKSVLVDELARVDGF